jgi:alcohol dehydrogenase class IV
MTVDNFVYDPIPVRTVFGYGTLATLGTEAEQLGLARPVVICSPGRIELGRKLAGLLAPAQAHVCDAGLTAMPKEAFDRLMGEIEQTKADGIVAVGGGSPIGLLKAAGAATQLPSIAVVTSYSGSEMAPNWYVGSGQDRYCGDSLHALPKVAIYDPELTLTLPPAASAASGMNAMNHAVESLYGPDTNPVIQDRAEEAVRLLGRSLPRIVDDPADREARYDALLGAWQAAMFRATSGIGHIIAQRVRTLFGLVHAESHAVAVPYGVGFNREAAPKAMARIARALGADDAARGLYDLNVRLGLATGYKALGVPADGLDRAVAVISKMSYPNPRTPTEDDIRGLLGRAFDGTPPVN